MPKIYRAMLEEGGFPKVGSERNMLGARPGVDIPVEEKRGVRPVTGGLSVNGCPCTMPPTVVPRRLRDVIPGAKAPDGDGRRVWSTGEGDFVAGQISEDLSLRPQHSSDLAGRQKGFVEPCRDMSFDGYQRAIGTTRESWNEDERPNPDCPVCGQP